MKVLYAFQCIKRPQIYVGSLDKQAESSAGAESLLWESWDSKIVLSEWNINEVSWCFP